MPRTKIVATLGPATDSKEKIASLIRAGVDVFRLNFSFRDHAYHQGLIKRIRLLQKKLKSPVTILADLQGPKIRLGELPATGLMLKKGSTVFLYSGHVARDGKIPIRYDKLIKEVAVGHRLLCDDGKIELRVEKKTKENLVARVIVAGTITTGKGVAFPDTTLSLSSITKKDLADARLAMRQGVDYIVASFVKTKDDLLFLKKRLKKGVRLMVKIEKKEALDNLDEILEVAHAAMIGRGDLALEIPLGELTLAQKRIIRACRNLGKPVIVATEMLQSMTANPRPTRAEVTDVANAVIDHADAVMLSAETSTGQFPQEAVRVMSEVVTATERSAYDDLPLFSEEEAHQDSAMEKIAKLATLFSRHEKVKGLIILDGDFTFLSALVRHHPETIMVVPAADPTFIQQINLFWGVKPLLIKKQNFEGTIKNALKEGRSKKWWKKKNLVLVTDYQGRMSVHEV